MVREGSEEKKGRRAGEGGVPLVRSVSSIMSLRGSWRAQRREVKCGTAWTSY